MLTLLPRAPRSPWKGNPILEFNGSLKSLIGGAPSKIRKPKNSYLFKKKQRILNDYASRKLGFF